MRDDIEKNYVDMVIIHIFQIEFKRRKNHSLTSNEVEDGVINSEDKKTEDELVTSLLNDCKI